MSPTKADLVETQMFNKPGHEKNKGQNGGKLVEILCELIFVAFNRGKILNGKRTATN